ncbi:MAG TPA: UDP-N-acetylglucosamine--N-acetylmuramyl-(pentapeptide) pyrophosphoryl-undecaprenol N-acetylglucosamine transferase [Candidatus Pacearchaeota archaeon]|nr:UDP-N-acetylglucosamine--N-acetylmuramyl-(pentapeptide) pyrophosphoryl-undecaprenol N-acetylglucosamine transferase [Candidatus Parcubacteria bacterium]HOC53403.1 UDP-N-acetylglucosamine--N-acetylmuramyl-(pentapeptide) pyrophosphoryl-undecaprenol N-acetylglucosamine transferase [Candidatus Pacearchaeota archaeon]HQM24349.1 UDP-N-acetylglucosamine--N-acetylmuramyl-(pentapeptide) pyrophosphoryl-undecaprenol N-acetylglucosamine transferase [Candidatus Pacearchaeota archaeon]
MKIIFTGGGTGGHIFPIIAVSRAIKRIGPSRGLDFMYLGPEDNFSKSALEKEGIYPQYILSGKIRRYFSIPAFFENIVDVLFKIPLGIIQAFYTIVKNPAVLVFSKGGYGSVPTVIAAWFLGIPIFLHESDISPGLSNKILSKFSKQIFVSFPVKETEYFPVDKMIKVGNPTRDSLLWGDKEKAKKIFNLKAQKPVILVLGGSQGSQRINDLILGVLSELLKTYEIIHQTGDYDFERVKTQANAFLYESAKQEYHAYGFISEDDLKHAYTAADCVISRAGSGIIFELAILKKPSILIPLPESAQNHQTKNAYAYAKYNACVVLEENNLSPNFFLKKINNIFETNQLEQMRRGAESFTSPYAADTIAKYLIEYISK